MKRLHWIQLIALNLLVVLCIFLPFLPGSYDNLALPISGIAQLTGYIGLLMVPIGILWLIQEIKKLTGTNDVLNNWSSGYYYGITTIFICGLLSIILVLALLLNSGISSAVLALIIIVFIARRNILTIRGFKKQKTFNAAPLYLLSVPLIAFAVCSFFISPVSEYSRNYAIKHGQEVIMAIETYRNQQGSYPESIEDLSGIPKPSVIGVDEFIYEKNGDAYNLAFVQHQHIGATREVVMYNKNDEHNVKGHFATYNAKQAHWKYYWLD